VEAVVFGILRCRVLGHRAKLRRHRDVETRDFGRGDLTCGKAATVVVDLLLLRRHRCLALAERGIEDVPNRTLELACVLIARGALLDDAGRLPLVVLAEEAEADR